MVIQNGIALFKRGSVVQECRAKFDFQQGGGVVRIPRFTVSFPFSLWFILPNFLMSKNFGFRITHDAEVFLFHRKNCMWVDERSMMALPTGSALVLDTKLLTEIKFEVEVWLNDKSFRAMLGKALTLFEWILALAGGYGIGKGIELVVTNLFGAH